MASSKAIFFLCLNLMLFTLVCSNYVPTPTPTTPLPPSCPTPADGKCPNDALKIAACTEVLMAMEERKSECCSLLDGLVGVDASLCLCTRLKAALLGFPVLNLSISSALLPNLCGKGDLNTRFQCPTC
ncbi:cortical cell-delineating protein-like [Silene latifolia]|uniref:cortical cell-delineating protein-like n=1 Tax=Silene latifolia TaxID=37657 RepID=UPI003D77A5F2